MTLEEKLVMLHGPEAPLPSCECKPGEPNFSPACAYTGNVEGNNRLGIPPIHMNDGPQGFRDSIYPGTSTQFPSGLALAASWDVSAVETWGAAKHWVNNNQETSRMTINEVVDERTRFEVCWRLLELLLSFLPPDVLSSL